MYNLAFGIALGNGDDQNGQTKKYTKKITIWDNHKVYFGGRTDTDFLVSWRGTLESALLKFSIDTFIIGTSFKVWLNNNLIIEGTQYVDRPEFSKDVKDILNNGINNIAVEVSWLGVPYFEVSTSLEYSYTCTESEEEEIKDELDEWKKEHDEYDWQDIALELGKWALIAGVAIAGLYFLGKAVGRKK